MPLPQLRDSVLTRVGFKVCLADCMACLQEGETCTGIWSQQKFSLRPITPKSENRRNANRPTQIEKTLEHKRIALPVCLGPFFFCFLFCLFSFLLSFLPLEPRRSALTCACYLSVKLKLDTCFFLFDGLWTAAPGHPREAASPAFSPREVPVRAMAAPRARSLV